MAISRGNWINFVKEAAEAMRKKVRNSPEFLKELERDYDKVFQSPARNDNGPTEG
jgi:hypothetical protein